MKDLDVRSNDTIIVYDKTGMTNAPRALWMFKNMGIDVAILNGTFSKWEVEKRQTETGDKPTAWKRVRTSQATSNDFSFKLSKDKIKSFE